MISPPRPDQPYPGRLPPVRKQWAQRALSTRLLLIVVPVAALAVITAFSATVGVPLAVLVIGMAAATAVYVKNRTDRHNAAIDRGEIVVVTDPHFRAARPADLPAAALAILARDGLRETDIGRVQRYDTGWIVRRRNPRDVAVLVGDDGGWARFDPRTVTDLWAVSEYRAGRGREDS